MPSDPAHLKGPDRVYPVLTGLLPDDGRFRNRALRAMLTLLVGCGALALGGCGESTTAPQIPPLISELTAVNARAISWTTDFPTLGTVRYGFVSGQYDRLAYPAAAGGADKDYTRVHTVSLLGAVIDMPIYIQRTDRSQAGHLYVAAEETIQFTFLPDQPPLLTMTSLDVQFGDSHVLRLPSEDKLVMIDAGNPSVSRLGQTAPAHVKSWLDDHGIERIDIALSTHDHADHIGGFVNEWPWTGTGGILQSYEIGVFLDMPAHSRFRSYYEDVQEIIATEGIALQLIAHGMTETSDPEVLGWDPLVRVLVLNSGSQPAWSGMSYDGDAINNDSIVLKISYGDVDIITGGDCEVPGEQFILSEYRDALADVEYYKAHHHGRADGSSEAFVNAVAPRVSIIPVALVAYNEGPDEGLRSTEQTLGRLRAVDADIFRFGSAGPLGREDDNRTFWHTSFVTDGRSYEMRIEPSLWGI